MRNTDRARMIHDMAERLFEQTEAHEEWVRSHGSTWSEKRGEGHTVSEILRSVDIMRSELMQLKKIIESERRC